MTDVARIRAKAGGYTQAGFGKMIGVPVGTVRHWEHGKRQPNGAALTLLRLLDTDPDIIRALLQRAERAERQQRADAAASPTVPLA